MIPNLICFIAGTSVGGAGMWWIRQTLDLYKIWSRSFNEQKRLARSAEIQNEALEKGNTDYGVFGNFPPEGSPGAVAAARKEATRLLEALQ